MPGYILQDNLSDAATITAIDPITGTAAIMLRPLTQLKVKWCRGLMRGPDNGSGSAPAELILRVDLGSVKFLHGAAIIGLNGVSRTQADFKFSATTPGGSSAGAVSVDYLPTYDIPDSFGQPAFAFFESGISARYMEAHLYCWGRSSGERYVDARRLLIMRGCRVEDGFDFDWSELPVDQSVVEVTPRGGVFVAEEGQYRVASLGISGMTKAEARSNSLDANDSDSLERVLSSAGRRKEVLIARRLCSGGTDSENSIEQVMASAYARLVDWSPIVHTGGDTYACDSITVHETPYPAL